MPLHGGEKEGRAKEIKTKTHIAHIFFKDFDFFSLWLSLEQLFLHNLGKKNIIIKKQKLHALHDCTLVCKISLIRSSD